VTRKTPAAPTLRTPPSRTRDHQVTNGPVRLKHSMATWRSGYAAACKAVYTGSIPVVASMRTAQ
jgi:hypothetical protein